MADIYQKTIIIKYINKQHSEIELKNNIIKLSLLHFNTSPVTIIAHETSHIALAGLTNGANNLNRFRFFDEGFANIIGAKANNTFEDFKNLALLVSYEYYTKRGIRFVNVQDWKTFFQKDRNPDTYLIGASFCFFIIDQYGDSELRQLFVEVGKLRDLDLAFIKIFRKSKIEIEREWGSYLSKTNIDLTSLGARIVEMYPKHGMNKVPVNTKEIYVEFDKKMNGRICVKTPCNDTGICYNNACWKTGKILAIKIENGLKKRYPYELVLSPNKTCRLSSSVGVQIPPKQWHFITQ